MRGATKRLSVTGPRLRTVLINEKRLSVLNRYVVVPLNISFSLIGPLIKQLIV